MFATIFIAAVKLLALLTLTAVVYVGITATLEV